MFKSMFLTNNTKNVVTQHMLNYNHKVAGLKNMYSKYFNFCTTTNTNTKSTSNSDSKNNNTMTSKSNDSKTYKIIPIKINEPIMPYSKSLKYYINDGTTANTNNNTNNNKTINRTTSLYESQLAKILKRKKPDNADYCVFLHDYKRNKTSNIGIRCNIVNINSNSNPNHTHNSPYTHQNQNLTSSTIEISIFSKENESRVYVAPDPSIFDINNSTLESEEFVVVDNELASIEAVEFSDNENSSALLLDYEIAKNLISDINKVIFAFYEITTKQYMIDNSLIKEVNLAIIFLQNILKINMDFMNSAYHIKKESFLNQFNSLLYENINEFLKLCCNFKKFPAFNEANSFLNSQDPIERTKILTELIYEIGDYIIKDLHMFDEYKKESMQRNEKYMLRFIKKQIEKISSGESAEIYYKKLETMCLNKDIEEQTKRSIALEIDLAFNSGNSDSEMEDKKKYHILEDIYSFPWSIRDEIKYDVKFTEQVLNNELFGLEKVKNRIFEYIAKQKRINSMDINSTTSNNSNNTSNTPNTTQNSDKSKKKGFVILITGPPGTGKTTVAQLIGKALQRKTGIINLSGETDTINLKGSRRTYIDSQPSIFFKEMVKLGVRNPVIILDEIDKIANKGDTMSHSASAALLELLNPEENHNFIDQYLNIPLDFSEAIFICTSNYNVNLLEPLLDRIEILEIDDYTFKEKHTITENFLIPSTLKEYGFINDAGKSQRSSTSSNNTNTDNTANSTPTVDLSNKIVFSDYIIDKLIKEYSPYSTGVRGIKRSVEKLIRKANIELIYNSSIKEMHIDLTMLNKHLNKDKILDENMLKLIKDSKLGFLVSDGYGNIDRMFIKPKPFDVFNIKDNSNSNNSNTTNNINIPEETINQQLKKLQISTKDIYKNIDILCKLSKPVKESLNISTNLAKNKIEDLLVFKKIPIDSINLLKNYSLYMTNPYRERKGNTFGLVFYINLVASMFEIFPQYDNMLILGELSPSGRILKVINLKYILSSCEFYGVNVIVLPEGKFLCIFLLKYVLFCIPYLFLMY